MSECYSPELRKPRLIWSGRDRSHAAEPLPAQVIEVVRPNQEVIEAVGSDLYQTRLDVGGPSQERLSSTAPPLLANRLIWTNDNLVALTSLLKGDAQHPPLEGQVDLIYIDPPFAVQSDFNINIEIENGASDEKQPTLIEELAYRDTWKNGLDSYLSMMRDRLDLLKRLLAPTGSIYVHCDWHAGHYLKVLMDEIFGYENFVNEIVWHYYNKMQGNINHFASDHDILYLYKKGESFYFNRRYEDRDKTIRQIKRVWSKQSGKIVNAKDDSGHILYQESTQRSVDDVWRISMLQPADQTENVRFPTQKPLKLVERVIAASTKPGDLVLDAFVGSGTTAVAAETMKDADGRPAPRCWIAMDCSKFAVHITRKRLIEASARPFSVENVGFYTRADEWRDLWAERPAARVYRDALVEIYGGTPVEGYAHLHGRKGNHWVHIGPLNAPVSAVQVRAVAAEAAGTDVRAVDILSADIPIDWDRTAAERDQGIAVYAKVIPQAAVDAVRERVRRLQRRDATLAEPPAIHFFSPPDVEVRVRVHEETATVTLTRLTVDLDDCLATQDAARRAEIKQKVTDWKALVDYWAVDWDWREGEPFQNDWQAFRTRKHRQFPTEASHSYGTARGEHRVAVKVTDIFGNDGLRVARVSV